MKETTEDVQSSDSTCKVSFEEAITALEQIVRELEDGQLGLDDSLQQYEHGMKNLRRCYQLLEGAERRIELLQGLDDQGQAVTEPFEEASESLEEKAKSRSRRRTSRPSDKADGAQNASVAREYGSKSEDSADADDNNIDLPGALF